jgi:alkylation response protein AidB-like acyl-CoA dehydrogenase
MPPRSPEQDQFAAALHDLLSRPAPSGRPDTGSEPGADVSLHAARRWAGGDRAAGLALWRDLAGLGVTALTVPESCDGPGATPLDLVVACEELGHHAVPGPVAESLAAVPRLLAALRGPAAAEWLRGLTAGDLIAALALPPRLPCAADADAAGLVLLAEDDTIWLAAPGPAHRSVDPARSLFEVRREQVLASGPEAAGAVRDALRLGALASAAQLLGAGRALLEASVRHARVRVQFGQPIGAFQAVQHRLADVAIGLEFARPLLDAAACALAGGQPTAARDVSAAKVACADAAHQAARAALQVHGAIGYTWEHDLGLWLTKVRALIPAWGTQAQHRAEVIAALTPAGQPARPGPPEAAWS